VQLGARLEPDGQAQPGDVHERELAQIEHDGTAAVAQDGVHLAFQLGHGEAVELSVHLDKRGLTHTLGCGAQWFDQGKGSVKRLVQGAGVRIDPSARIEVARGARVVLGRGVVVGPDARITAHGGTVKVGAGARLGERAVVVSHVGVEIGEAALIGDWAAIEGAAPTFADVEWPIRDQPLLTGVTSIGAGAVVGMHAVIGAGARVPAGATVEPYAVVRDVTSRS
jgi:carbonic anhydrase/acetyltransferase-like protein (isoleucine patch superfamily)